ncbi:MAG: hypothetical protein A2898_02750 [Candidatus Kerfeldbacteria bacterium RIFCSPLOWO2_01_FULL_48_11]|uniref:Peptidase S9 prolyl oligopeptidase catalytic domain-containing protein n=1 Tax=Candidatus Kerfeldbacteria bacterium RIFCSPLOWO2_01_FULL_48_11 TaxID=1798543 RepID=A0A1G2B8L6_9BACT|nr:MAG: hypothetical protein UY34_C0011G0050 [Parcubacteria group bacterium GW2011_GWA2_48_9]KKW13913.1 MAG: hypothetical protein UY52_C0035G0006 [Parcubacteria group bacterium GW2011_GWC2_49_9]OGY85026.1 MAG: hypothetical protein A2898_02750 [Candidatus Kerfeldbacteria bacterium RIFCSPLOWO2_01_FULL_48_11]HCJ52491.1 hypothetical protein [Candidatus Kerfeldbacteria bacterium]HCM68640.1 hypothetical protein [Candidatus Kerfeldbacteria bacterium]
MTFAWLSLGVLLGCAIFLLIVLSLYYADRVIRQPRETHPDELRKYGLSGNNITFYARDGIKLIGMFFPGTNGATIILLHGFSRSKEQMLPQASFLHKAGYGVLMFDFRASGESGGKYITFGVKEQFDLESAIRYLKNRPEISKDRIGVVGFSMGGAVAILKGSDIPEIKAYVINSAFSRMSEVIKKNFHEYLPHIPFYPFGYIALLYIRLRTGAYFPHINPVQSISRLSSRPILLIHGARDETIPSHQARELARSSAGNVELWEIPGADHHGAYTAARDEYERRVLSFFSQHLLM